MRSQPSHDKSVDDAATLPVNLLLKGRLCLFVGAGHVARRKLDTILEHGGRVIVVAPEVCPEIERHEAAGRIGIRTGRYEPRLLDELRPFLVYAATDDDDVNRQVVEDAARRGFLASSASSWRRGDFISPSVLKWSKGQVSITTEGASCRHAKFMRRRLGDLLGGDREFLVVGVDLRSLTLAELERVRPTADQVSTLVAMLRQLAALEEFVLLATCNRLELYACTRREPGLVAAIVRLMGLEAVKERLYVSSGDEVVEHAANVVAGHYSQVICETQITCQFKAAFQRAFAEGVAAAGMQGLHDRVLKLSKKLRSLHGASRVGLPELVARVVGERMPVSGGRVLLLGAGALACEIADRLTGIDGVSLTWANRTKEKIPAQPAGRRVTLDEALDRLCDQDQVVCALGAAEPVIRCGHLEGAAHRPLLIDLGLPRNVSAQLRARDGIEVLDLGDFREQGADRRQLVALAHTVAQGRLVVARG